MMLIIVLLKTSIILFLCSTCLFLAHKISIYRAHHKEIIGKKKCFVIAILSQSKQTPYLTGFISHLKKFAAFEFETIECITFGNPEKTYDWADYIANNNIDLVYTIGKKTFDITLNVLKTRNYKIPIVAGAIPHEACDVPIEEMQKSHPLTASICFMDWHKKISLLKKIFPACKKALVLYRSVDEISHANLKEKNQISAALRKNHISWTMHHINNVEKSTELSSKILKDIDLVIISRSSELTSHSAKIVSDANRMNVPVFSTYPSEPGVFISINENIEIKFGETAAKQAIQILEDNIEASDIPVQQVSGPYNLCIKSNSKNISDLTTVTVIGALLNLDQHAKIYLN